MIFNSLYDFIITIFFPKKIQLIKRKPKLYQYKTDANNRSHLNQESYIDIKKIDVIPTGESNKLSLEECVPNVNYIPPSLKINGKEMFERLHNTRLTEDVNRRGYKYMENGVLKFISEEELEDW